MAKSEFRIENEKYGVLEIPKLKGTNTPCTFFDSEEKRDKYYEETLRLYESHNIKVTMYKLETTYITELC